MGVGWQSEEAILVLQARVEGLGEFSPSLANAWNAAKRWPRAWVQEGGVVLDFQVFLPGEVDAGAPWARPSYQRSWESRLGG